MNHPILPSIFPSGPPSLFFDSDGGCSGSESSSPADSPTFHKNGESSRLSEVKPMFHPPTNDFYKVWWEDGRLGKQSCDTPYFSSYQNSAIPDQDIGVWDCLEDMDVDTFYGSSSTLDSSQDAGTQWPLWDPNISSSIPVSAARSSLQLAPPNHSAVRSFWRGSPIEHGLFGPASPLSSTTPFHSAAKHPSLTQPHNNHYDTTGSPYHYNFSASSFPTERIVSTPIPCSISPTSSSSQSSPISTPSSSYPPTPPTPVLLPELRQPRPGRPIPIIPLSELATACEKFYIPSLKEEFGSSDQLSPISPNSDPHFLSLPSKHPSHDSYQVHSRSGNFGEKSSTNTFTSFYNDLGFHNDYRNDFT